MDLDPSVAAPLGIAAKRARRLCQPRARIVWLRSASVAGHERLALRTRETTKMPAHKTLCAVEVTEPGVVAGIRFKYSF
jgi:hypothetical protein